MIIQGEKSSMSRKYCNRRRSLAASAGVPGSTSRTAAEVATIINISLSRSHSGRTFLLTFIVAVILLAGGILPGKDASAAAQAPLVNVNQPTCPGITPVTTPRSTPALPFKFSFGAGPVASGYTQVLPSTAYSAARGYGFASTTNLVSVDRGAPDALHRHFITSSQPFTFNADLPNGNYTVTVISGDNAGSSATTVKAEFGRIALNKVTTTAGQFAQKTFTVNVADEQLNLQFTWTAPKIEVLEIARASAITVFLAGDSTVCDQPPLSDPYVSYGGWGQMLTSYFKPGVAVANYAAAGRTSISFINEGRLNDILRVIKPNDYLFIQFGHNDEHAGSGSSPFTTYEAALQKYIDGARVHQAIPVLVTPVARRSFDSHGTIVDTHGQYPVAMRQLAAAQHVQLIDLTALSMAYFQKLGPTGTQSVFFFLPSGVSPDFPDGVADNTHFQVNGAIQVAGLVSGAIKTQQIQPLASYLM
jgi:fibronectin type 3 domain-containing protein